jgi:hypothetical protein
MMHAADDDTVTATAVTNATSIRHLAVTRGG